jgi:hypothetical protein
MANPPSYTRGSEKVQSILCRRHKCNRNFLILPSAAEDENRAIHTIALEMLFPAKYSARRLYHPCIWGEARTVCRVFRPSPVNKDRLQVVIHRQVSVTHL